MRKLTRHEQYEHWLEKPRELRELEYQACLRHHRMQSFSRMLQILLILMVLIQVGVDVWTLVKPG